MIFTNKTKEEIEREERTWKPWFAWHPVRISPTETVWLERVERRILGWRSCLDIDGGSDSYALREYRRIQATQKTEEIQ